MSTRHRWFAVYLALAVCLPSPNLPAKPPTAADSATGPVGLRDLIVLALQNDPELVALRLNIPIEEARKRAAWQWRDPEIRIGHSKDDNIQLDQPYYRSGSIRETINGDLNRTETGGRNGTTNETGSSQEIRETYYREKVIPGAHSDRIIRQESQNRFTNSSSTSAAQGFDPTTQTRSDTETFHTTTDETRYDSRDRFARDETTSIKARFWIPNPWEMRQRVKRAAREVELASYQVTQAERQVILRVRGEYEKLQYLYKKLEASRKKIPVIRAHIAREKELLGAGGEFTIDQSRFENIDIPTIEIEILTAEMELETAKRQLAMSVGLNDGSRIRLTDTLLRSTINLHSTDLDYLTRMAFAFRGEVGILKHEQAIAESELALVKSKNIPFFSFVEAAYAKDSTGRFHTNDNYGVQFGVILPLFSWLSKDEKVVEARIESFYGSLEANQKNIANEVAEAFRDVKSKAKFRDDIGAAVAKQKAVLEASATSLDGSPDLAAKERLRYRIESIRSESYEHILNADRLYNQSLIRLEQALGADLDQVFSFKFESPSGGPAAEVTAAAAAAEVPAYLSGVPKAQLVGKSADTTEPEKAARRGIFTRPVKGFPKFKNK